MQALISLMLDPAQLAALATVHRRGAFDLAAAELGVTPSAISQRIKALEDTAGTLLIRRGQPCGATETGLRLIRHHDEIALLTHSLAADLPGLGAGPARLRIAVSADSLATWVVPALAATKSCLFDLVIYDQDVSQELLRRGDVIAAITSHPGPLQGCDTISLGVLRYRAIATPAFIARWFPHGVTPEALAKAPVLSFSEADHLQDRWVAGLPGAGERPPVMPYHRLASSQAFVEACRHSLAWGMNPETLIASDLKSKVLAELVADTALDVPLYWQFTRLAAPALAPLTAAIRAVTKTALVQATS